MDFIKNKKFKNVFIHDAARPNFSLKLLKKLNFNLKENKAVVPYVTTDNSTKYKVKNKIQNLDREYLLFTQTPQCFDFKTLYNLSKSNNIKITDEVSLFLNNNSRPELFFEANKYKFLTGSLFFETKPNYDSLFPYIDYIRNDIKKMVDSFRWIYE